ncbi:MAG TPA: pyrrolidone-carboxylate peptidase [Planctomycetaceae bacterium]|nr:pyrrolidone-carboxylate peptidase [Planctomycetaceae bacterium]
MQRVLITAFEPYDQWSENASWLALIELTKSLPEAPEITTRRYPVDYNELAVRLADDLVADYDVALHLGQAPGTCSMQLEAVGLNVASRVEEADDGFRPLAADGPDAYLSSLPLSRWAEELRGRGVPATISHHAGTYLCNAALYLSQHIAATRKLKLLSTFVHVPLCPAQALQAEQPAASLSTAMVVDGLQRMLELIREMPGRED